MKCRCGRELVRVSSGRWAHAENPTWQHHYPRPVPTKAAPVASSSYAAPRTRAALVGSRRTLNTAWGTAE